MRRRVKFIRPDGIVEHIFFSDEPIVSKNLTVTSKHPGNPLIHLEHEGRPACGAKAEGALVAEEKEHVNCKSCSMLTAIGMLGGITIIDRRN